MPMPKPKEIKSQDLDKLNGKHYKIIQLLAMGISQVDIAETLGITQATVSKVKNSTLGREEMRHIHEEFLGSMIEAQELLDHAQYGAILALKREMEAGDSSSARVAAAKALLDKGSFPNKQVNVNKNKNTLNMVVQQVIQNASNAGIIAEPMETLEATPVEDVNNNDNLGDKE
jgi:DNA-binding CsgD family transcriptional regulator